MLKPFPQHDLVNGPLVQELSATLVELDEEDVLDEPGMVDATVTIVEDELESLVEEDALVLLKLVVCVVDVELAVLLVEVLEVARGSNWTGSSNDMTRVNAD